MRRKKKCKTVAAAVVKGKIYFYCLKEIGNEWNGEGKSKKKFSLSIVRKGKKYEPEE